MRRVAAFWICALLLIGGATVAQGSPEIGVPRLLRHPQPDFCSRGDVCVTSKGAAVIEVP